MKKRILALALALVMMVALLPTTASAANITEAEVTKRLEGLMNGTLGNGNFKVGKKYNTECLGFAVDVFNAVFGTAIPRNTYANARLTNHTGMDEVAHLDAANYSSSGFSESEYIALLKQAKRGDLLLLTNTGNATYGHAMIIWDVSNPSKPLVYDANATAVNKEFYGEKCSDYEREHGCIIGCHSYQWAYAKHHNGAATLYRYKSDASTTQTSSGTAVTIKEDIYTISPKCAPSRCLDVRGNSKKNSANVELYINAKTANQQWKVESVGDGYYKLVSQRSQLALDVYNGDKQTANGTNVQQYKYTASHNAQKWKFEDAGDGYYYIVPMVNNSLCLDVSGGADANFANVQIYTRNNSNAQKWKLTPVNSSATTATTTKTTATSKPATTTTSTASTTVTAPTTTATAAPTPTPTPAPQKSWSEWSAWSTTPVTKSDTREVKTRQVEVTPARTEYRYGRYMAYNGPKTQDTYWCTTYARSRGYASVSAVQYTSWSTSRVSPSGGDYTCGFCKGNHIGVDHYSSDGRPWWHTYQTNSGEYYWEETRTVAATYRTEYSYSDYK